jgi:hypothetical protein
MFAESRMDHKIEDAQEELARLQRWIAQASEAGKAFDEVERQVFRAMLEIGRLLVGRFLALTGPGDLGESVAVEGIGVLRRWPEQQLRRLVSVFGEFETPRCVYGTRPGQKIELVPTDQRLRLPESDLSYLLQEWDQLLGVEHAFGAVARTLEAILSLKQSVDTLERGNQQMAQSAAGFREQQPIPAPEQEKQLLVVSEDNKGVPMVRPTTAPPPGIHRKKGEKANKKQMACIGCVYTVDLHIRTPEELVAVLFREAPRPRQAPPAAAQKRYRVSLSREREDGQVIRAQEEVFEQLSEEIQARRKPGQVLLHLCDGQHSLETDGRRYLPPDTLDILDLMHVLPRLWEAAHLFHAEGSAEATAFMQERLLDVLEGRASRVIRYLRGQGTRKKLMGERRKRLDRLCQYLQKNRHRMRYNEYLKAGYPIATGVIEGACRHVIKDRMERTGMRWKVPGAQAMLQLRVIRIHGDWRAFQQYRVEQENRRLYPHANATEHIPWPIAA